MANLVNIPTINQGETEPVENSLGNFWQKWRKNFCLKTLWKTKISFSEFQESYFNRYSHSGCCLGFSLCVSVGELIKFQRKRSNAGVHELVKLFEHLEQSAHKVSNANFEVDRLCANYSLWADWCSIWSLGDGLLSNLSFSTRNSITK